MKEEQNNNNAQEQQLFIADVSCYAIWKEIPSRYVPATALYIGKVEIARYFYDGLTNRDDENKYKVISKLPSIKEVIGKFKDEESCRSVCIRVAKVFCEQLQHYC